MKNPKIKKQKVIASKTKKPTVQMISDLQTKTGQTKVVAANKKPDRFAKGKKYEITNVDAKAVSGFIVPPLTSKQKKVLQTPIPMLKDEKYTFKGKFKLQDKPLIAGWEDSIISTPAKRKKEVAKQKPKTLAKFTSIAELKKTLLWTTKTAKLYLIYNKITKQYWWRSVGLNGEVLGNSEPMHNKKDVLHNIKLHIDLFF